MNDRERELDPNDPIDALALWVRNTEEHRRRMSQLAAALRAERWESAERARHARAQNERAALAAEAARHAKQQQVFRRRRWAALVLLVVALLVIVGLVTRVVTQTRNATERTPEGVREVTSVV